MNEVIERILNHRSIRSFEDTLLSKEQIQTIVDCAQAASSSSFIQAYTIIGVTDQEKKATLANVVGSQEYVAENGHLFVFCADLHRHDVIAEMEEKDLAESLESTEKFMVACIDAALAAQNAALAAESMGLGICYIGGIRNDLPTVTKLLNIPSRVIPLFGMTVGYPKHITDKKPRLPRSNVYHENNYQQDKETFIGQLQDYNEIVSQYYEERTNGKRRDTWTGQMAGMLDKKSRMYMKEFVENQGFNKR
ncbi:oxygen-insensitive NADPH nitroreductase [Bacillus sp. CECT 9360]|uniref:oxygen-insensitive NADPH nitroreductase n=1 Tax=Bacillus sp. CECT 9360 TaxID=2845821 RepID=UPI001E322483|nr:oxygen-insensitive NADPH nitroreductase [Bacillus sp. CECT 9360]CAH0344180.1 FMN reductase (NADPH) [Bacillus sp. CECT 9360]